MLQFEYIKEDTADEGNIDKTSMPKDFVMVYTDDELAEKAIPGIWEKLNEHDFEGDAENIDFVIYFDNLKNVCKIIIAIYYPEDDFNVPELDKIANQYRPVFETFYNENKPY